METAWANNPTHQLASAMHAMECEVKNGNAYAPNGWLLLQVVRDAALPNKNSARKPGS